jgi:hypothetical protein
MEVSLFLAKFWGWYLLIFFLILSYNPRRIKQIFEDLRDQKFAILVAFLAVILGLLNILFHNVWESDWRLIITGLGWLALLFGFSLFTFPAQFINSMGALNIKLIQVIYVLFFLIGLYLLNVVYGLVPY